MPHTKQAIHIVHEMLDYLGDVPGFNDWYDSMDEFVQNDIEQDLMGVVDTVLRRLGWTPSWPPHN